MKEELDNKNITNAESVIDCRCSNTANTPNDANCGEKNPETDSREGMADSEEADDDGFLCL